MSAGPIASVRLATHQISSLPRIFETTSNVSVRVGAILLYLTSPGSIARAVARTGQRSSSRAQALDWGDETDSYCGLPCCRPIDCLGTGFLASEY